MSNAKRVSIYIILFISLLVSVFFGFQKSGFHEDEYYTYYSSNRSLGLYQPDREWQTKQTILDEFSVKEGEGFNYGLVKLVQSWDVHPPIYYFVFHTVCSFTPGVFTKWSGLAVNLIAYVISFLVLWLLMRRCGVPFFVQIMTLVFWGFNPMTISSNMLIRMYSLLTAAIFICAYVHIRLMQDFYEYEASAKTFILKYMLPLMVVSYVGFLIQYFYLFFFVSIGFAFTIWLLLYQKDIKDAVIYVCSCALSLGLAVLSYPASLSHMFGGYRGSEAAGSLFDIQNSFMRLSFFIGLLNDYVFGGGLFFVIIFIAIALMAIMIKNKKHRKIRAEAIVLAAGTFGYFLLTAKSALLVGSASNRYEMPIYGLIIMLLFWDAYFVVEIINNKSYLYAITLVMAAFLLKGLFADQNVLFLYKGDVAKMEYASQNSNDSVAVVMFNPATPQNVWRLTDELLEYDKVYYMDEENLDTLTDLEVIEADKIILYAADDDLQQEAFDNLLDSCPNLSDMIMVFQEDMWSTYELN